MKLPRNCGAAGPVAAERVVISHRSAPVPTMLKPQGIAECQMLCGQIADHEIRARCLKTCTQNG